MSADRSNAVRSDWLSTLRDARAIAVVGASNDERRPGGRVVAALRRFQFDGRVFPVNPGREEVQGLPCFPSLGAIDQRVDIAFVVVAADQTAAVVAECASIGVPLVILGSAGFKESGAEGELLEKAVIDHIGPNMRVIGPNTNGIIWLETGVVASFSPALQQPILKLRHGPAAIVSQSGALGAATFTLAQSAGLDIGLMINTGNEADVGFEEVLDRICQPDTDTSVVLTYIEGLSDPGAFITAARLAAQRNIILVMLKVGNTKAGAAAAAAHTAKLSGSDRAFDGILRQLGVVRAGSLSDLTGIGLAARSQRPFHGSRLTVASLSGGLGIIVADAAEANGLRLAPWTPEWQSKLDPLLPKYLGRKNPIDLGGGPFWDLPRLRQILELIDAAPDSDVTVLAIANFEGSQDSISAAIEETARGLTKPLVIVWYGGALEARLRLNRAGIPAFAEPLDAVRAIASLIHRRTNSRILREDGDVVKSRREHIRTLIAASTEHVLDQQTSAAILAEYEVPVVAQRTWNIDDATPPLVDFPCYVKLAAPGLTHKSDVGGVLLAEDEEQARNAVTVLRELAADLELKDAEIIVQTRVESGSELLLGMSQDPQFGAVLTLGLGGVLAEAVDDVTIRLPLLDAADVQAMLGDLRHQALVRGFRGLPGFDHPRVTDAVLGFSALVREVGDLFRAVDVNPLIVGRDGSVACVDAVFIRQET